MTGGLSSLPRRVFLIALPPRPPCVKGERADRRRWRRKEGERVAAVGFFKRALRAPKKAGTATGAVTGGDRGIDFSSSPSIPHFSSLIPHFPSALPSSLFTIHYSLFTALPLRPPCERGSEPPAAGGGGRKASEWPRSAFSSEHCERRKRRAPQQELSAQRTGGLTSLPRRVFLIALLPHRHKRARPVRLPVALFYL